MRDPERPDPAPKRPPLPPRAFHLIALATMVWAIPKGPSAGWYEHGYDLCMGLIAQDRDWECDLILPAPGE